MSEHYANNYATTLNGAINNSQTTFTVTSATGAPTVNFRIKVENEIMLVTNVATLTFTVTRAQDSTSAASHADLSAVTHIVTAVALNELTHSDWTTYTPTWTAVTTNPTLGSTTITGRWKLLDSHTGIAQISIVITTGGAWNAGSGAYSFSLPSGWTAATGRLQIGSGHVLDSGTTHFVAAPKVLTGGTTISEVPVGDAAGNKLLSNSVPVTWATNDQINLGILLEIQ